MIALCQRCGRQGPMAGEAQPAWCTCTGRCGPYVAPPGHVTVYRFENAEASAFREACRLAGNAMHAAKDRLAERYVRHGRGYRELPPTHPKRRYLYERYAAAWRVLERLQRACAHPERSPYNPEACGVCYARVESDVARHRYMVREGLCRPTRRRRAAA